MPKDFTPWHQLTHTCFSSEKKWLLQKSYSEIEKNSQYHPFPQRVPVSGFWVVVSLMGPLPSCCYFSHGCTYWSEQWRVRLSTAGNIVWMRWAAPWRIYDNVPCMWSSFGELKDKLNSCLEFCSHFLFFLLFLYTINTRNMMLEIIRKCK